jgi:hypothetical protein
MFHLASHVHYALRIALLFRETLRRSGTRMSVSVGEPVSAAELAAFGPREAVVAELRRRTMSLQGATAPSPDEVFRWPSHVRFDWPQEPSQLNNAFMADIAAGNNLGLSGKGSARTSSRWLFLRLPAKLLRKHNGSVPLETAAKR